MREFMDPVEPPRLGSWHHKRRNIGTRWSCNMHQYASMHEEETWRNETNNTQSSQSWQARVFRSDFWVHHHDEAKRAWKLGLVFTSFALCLSAEVCSLCSQWDEIDSNKLRKPLGPKQQRSVPVNLSKLATSHNKTMHHTSNRWPVLLRHVHDFVIIILQRPAVAICPSFKQAVSLISLQFNIYIYIYMVTGPPRPYILEGLRGTSIYIHINAIWNDEKTMEKHI